MRSGRCRTSLGAFRQEGAATATGWMLRAVVVPVVAALLLLLAPAPASAHAVSLGQSKIRQDGAVVHYELAVTYADLVTRISAAPTPGEVPDASGARTALLALRAELTSYLDDGVRVSRDGRSCAARLDTVEVRPFHGTLYAVLASTYRCAGTAGAVKVTYNLFFDARSEAESSSHSNVTDYDIAGKKGRFVFERDAQTLSAGGSGALGTAGRFTALGFTHILAGLDHVLFVLALLIGARSARTLVKVATTFTVAHSLTLLLAAAGWLVVPSGLVEPAIALSIVVVAVQNIVQREVRLRLLVVFLFGLLHGLGFAGGLSFGEEVSWRFLTSLLAFNVGIELGQASILLLATPLLLVLRHRRWSRTAQWVTSGLIAVCGVCWLVGRLMA